MRIRLSTIILLFLFLNVCLCPVARMKPQWLKEGFAAKYRVESDNIVTGIINASDSHRVVTGPAGGSGTYGWRVQSLNGSYSKIAASLDLIVLDHRDPETHQWVTEPWNKTAEAKLNVDRREITALNGTNLGKTCYWIDPTVQKGDNVTIYGESSNGINATIMDYTHNPLKIPAGQFDCWIVDVERAGSLALFLWYDKATGIMVAALGPYFDAVAMLMGALEINMLDRTGHDFLAPSSFVLESMVTSSPSDSTSTEFNGLSDYIPYIVAAAVVAAIPTAVYVARRDRKKHGSRW
jgi:hypothetical protein